MNNLFLGDCLTVMGDLVRQGVKTNRRFIGIEKDEKYFKTAEERINNA